MDNTEKLKQIIANVFDANINDINEFTSQDTLDNWDSIHQLNLVFALEEAFNIQLSDGDAVHLLSYELVKAILEEKGIQF